jgi:hypothetical protein
MARSAPLKPSICRNDAKQNAEIPQNAGGPRKARELPGRADREHPAMKLTYERDRTDHPLTSAFRRGTISMVALDGVETIRWHKYEYAFSNIENHF